MPHLERFRKGWENEHLATFLLSRLSFVANPVRVGDDLGTDLFCTLFEVAEGELFPRNSFAVQAKALRTRSTRQARLNILRGLNCRSLSA